jgi:predicted RNA-binding protein with PIN domain
VILIDGHNLLGRSPGLSLSDEAQGREALLRRLGAAKGSGREEVAVVFDGNRPGAAQEDRFGGLRIVYSPAGRTADEEILRRLGKGNPRDATVVTSDRSLAAQARAMGARAESCEAFLTRIGPRSRPDEPESKPQPSPAEVETWLALFRERQQGGKPPGR